MKKIAVELRAYFLSTLNCPLIIPFPVSIKAIQFNAHWRNKLPFALCRVAVLWACCVSSSWGLENFETLTYQLDWVPLDELSPSQKEVLPLGSCGAYIAPLRGDDEAKALPERSPLRASADRSTVIRSEVEGAGQVLLLGDVLITQGYRQLQAQQAALDKATQKVTIEGEMIIREPGSLIMGDKATIDQADNTLVVENAGFVFHDNHSRGQADKIARLNNGKLVLEGTEFTQCEPGNDAWALKGSRITLNYDSRQGVATHVRLLIEGVPVFYFPYLRFPLGDERLTGFLAPSLSYSEDGFESSIPLYLNLAPNYDLLLTAHSTALHGLLLEANGRHLSRYFSTDVNVAQIDKDSGKLNQAEQQQVDNGALTEDELVPFKGQRRWMVNIDQAGGEGKPWFTNIDYTKVSDIDFFRDFDQTGVAGVDDTSIKQSFKGGYEFARWHLEAEALQYQSLQGTGDVPYQQLPKLTAQGDYAFDHWSFALNHQLTRFTHKNASDSQPIITGDRFRGDYVARYDYSPEWGFIRPKAQVSTLRYQLNDRAFVETADQNPSITSAQFSLDTGLFFEREGSGYLQTFEPRLFYVRSPYQSHDALFDLTTDGRDIDFDTSELSFNFNQIFRDTRFAGNDRLGDANQVSVGLTTRFIGNQTGREWFSASVGQIFYQEDRRVTLDNTPQTQVQSDIAMQLRAHPWRDWRFTGDLLFDDDDQTLGSAAWGLTFLNQAQQGFDLNYRYTRGDPDSRKVDGSLLTPLFSQQWYLLFYGAYDYVNDRETDLLTAAEFVGCCYKLRLGYRHELNEVVTHALSEGEDYDHSWFFEIQFRGLGSTGRELDDLLNDKIDNYSAWQATHY